MLLARDSHEALRRLQGRDLVAPDRMRGRIIGDAQRLTLVQPIFVLRMKGGAPLRMGEDGRDARVVFDKQRPGRGAHENLDPQPRLAAVRVPHMLGIFMGAADPEGEIAVHSMLGAADLVGKLRLAHRQRVGVRHFEDGRDPAEDGRAGAGLQIFLMFETRFAEMHLGVDHAGQDVEPRGGRSPARPKLATNPLSGRFFHRESLYLLGFHHLD